MTIQDYHSEYQKLNHPDSGYFQVQLPIINRTEKAVCFDKNASDLGKSVPMWIPISQMKIVEFESAEDYNFSQHPDNRYFVKNWLSKNF